jgi:hypothetical protein
MENEYRGTVVYVYALLGSDNNPIYIGKSSSPKSRCYGHAQHFENKVVMKILDRYYDLESYWIKKYQEEGYVLLNKEIDMTEENWEVGDLIEINKQARVGVLHTTTGNRYKSISEASKALGISYSALQQTLNSPTRQLSNEHNVIRET